MTAEGDPPRPPGNVLGVPVPLQVVIVRSEDLVVALTGFAVQPQGAELVLTVRTPAPTDPLSDPDEIGMEIGFADGRVAGTASTTARNHPNPASLELVDRATDRGRTDLRFWLSPLPPRGRLTVTLAWPARQIAPTRVMVDAGALAEPAGKAEVLW